MDFDQMFTSDQPFTESIGVEFRAIFHPQSSEAGLCGSFNDSDPIDSSPVDLASSSNSSLDHDDVRIEDIEEFWSIYSAKIGITDAEMNRRRENVTKHLKQINDKLRRCRSLDPN